MVLAVHGNAKDVSGLPAACSVASQKPPSPAQHGASAEAVAAQIRARAQQQPMPSPTYELTSSPDALVVKVDLPDVKKASEVDLNISATRLHLIVPPEYAATRTL